ncbi:MAG: hypothetical protein QNL04_13880, partial [SAR324 cluster bacterium]|nr:hypothetical protein [SAR324 cluster bacterium]
MNQMKSIKQILITKGNAPRYGVDGNLYFRWITKKGSSKIQYRVTNWEQGLQLQYQNSKGEWRYSSKEKAMKQLPSHLLILLEPRHPKHKTKALKLFIEAIPEEIRKLTEGYQRHQ